MAESKEARNKAPVLKAFDTLFKHKRPHWIEKETERTYRPQA